MNGTSGFQELQSATSRSTSYRFLQEQRHRFGADSWRFFRTQDLIALFTGMSTKRKQIHVSAKKGAEAHE